MQMARGARWQEFLPSGSRLLFKVRPFVSELVELGRSSHIELGGRAKAHVSFSRKSVLPKTSGPDLGPTV